MHAAQIIPTHPTPDGTAGTHNRHKVAPGMLPELAAWKVPHKPRTHDLDVLIGVGLPDKHAASQKAAPLPETAFEAVLDATPGIFLGLRLALLFNAALGVMGMVIYEGWTMLAR